MCECVWVGGGKPRGVWESPCTRHFRRGGQQAFPFGWPPVFFFLLNTNIDFSFALGAIGDYQRLIARNIKHPGGCTHFGRVDRARKDSLVRKRERERGGKKARCRKRGMVDNSSSSKAQTVSPTPSSPINSYCKISHPTPKPHEQFLNWVDAFVFTHESALLIPLPTIYCSFNVGDINSLYTSWLDEFCVFSTLTSTIVTNNSFAVNWRSWGNFEVFLSHCSVEHTAVCPHC